MEEEQKKIAECPHCQTRYRLPSHLEKKTVACKKCGDSFVIQFQSESVPHSQPSSSPEKNDLASNESGEPENVLGKLALKFKIITPEQYQEVLAKQKDAAANGQDIPLEQVMVRENLISQDQLEYLQKVKDMREVRTLDREFGNLAVLKGWTSEKKVAAALEEQARIFTRSKTITLIGDIMVDNGALKEEHKQDLLVDQGRASRSAFSRVDTGEGGDSGVEFDVLISDDKLTAYVLPKDDIPPGTTPTQITETLQQQGIVYGVVSNAVIEEYLNTKSLHRTPWKVAGAMPPTPPQDAEIRCYFETDPLRIGKIKENGVIDFRDRGVVPQVKDGDVLAEKLPGVEGVAGVDLFGKPIPPVKPRTILLQCGSGTRRDPSGTKVLATKDGRPERTSSGVFHVFPEYQIKGNVDFHVGHVIFDGHVAVNGEVKEGFQVKSGSLSAREVNKAEIETENDVAVMEGIIGSHIRTGGNVRAKYISGSTIEARGSVVIENEIRNSRIEATGTVILTSGSIFGSEICTKQAVETQNVGSHAAASSTLIIGLDFGLKRQIEALKERVAELERNKNKLNERVEEINQQTTRFLRRMRELNDVWDVAAEQKYHLERRIALEEEAGETENREKLEKKLSHIQSLMEESQRYLEEVADKQESLINKIVQFRGDIDEADMEINGIHHEIDRLVESMKHEEDKSYIKVQGLLASGTVIKGRHSTYHVPENFEEALCREMRVKSEDGGWRWVMDVSHLY